VHHIEHCNRCIDKTQAKSAGKNIKKQDIFGFPKSGYFIALNGYICLCQNEIILNKSHLFVSNTELPGGAFAALRARSKSVQTGPAAEAKIGVAQDPVR
jgi:hypothetical protein